jgi:hypothetical protein
MCTKFKYTKEVAGIKSALFTRALLYCVYSPWRALPMAKEGRQAGS